MRGEENSMLLSRIWLQRGGNSSYGGNDFGALHCTKNEKSNTVNVLIVMQNDRRNKKRCMMILTVELDFHINFYSRLCGFKMCILRPDKISSKHLLSLRINSYHVTAGPLFRLVFYNARITVKTLK